MNDRSDDDRGRRILAQAEALERDRRSARQAEEERTTREADPQEALANAELIEPVDPERRRVDLRIVQRPALQAARAR
jgi:hypothetical protein